MRDTNQLRTPMARAKAKRTAGLGRACDQAAAALAEWDRQHAADHQCWEFYRALVAIHDRYQAALPERARLAAAAQEAADRYQGAKHPTGE